MKRFKMLFLLAILMVGLLAEHRALAQPGLSVSFQTFYNELSPYGRWTSHPQYGSIWTPYVDRDFQPYATNGQWMMTEYGNTWVSDYDWGWAPFHYGRWFYDDFYGWAWVPDYEWGPAWVDWRTGGGYYGWAPMWPGIRVGFSFNIPLDFWVFVPQRYISRPRVFGYCLPRTRVVNVFHQTTIINNYYRNDNRVYAYGPRHSEIERVTRSNVPVYRSDEVRGSRYTSTRQDADGTYRANGTSESRLYRQDRNENGSINSNRRLSQSEATDRGAASNRTYDANTSRRGRSSYESNDDNRRDSYSNRTNEADIFSPQRSYESAEPSSRARSNTRTNGHESSSRYSMPEGRSSAERPVMGSRGMESRSSGNSDYSGSRPRSSSQVPSRSNSQYSERARTQAPAAQNYERSSGAPRSSGSSSTNSSERPSSNRSRGPR